MTTDPDDDRTGSEFSLSQFFDRAPEQPADSPEFRHHYGWLRTYYRHRPGKHRPLQRWLNQGRFGQNYDRYLARSALYAIVAALVGVLAGVVATLVLQDMGVIGTLTNPFSVRGELTVYIGQNRALFSGALVAIALASAFAAATWYARYYYPRSVASSRRHNIDVTLPHAITFMYALSHGGMSLLEVAEVLGDAEDTYGEVANEFQMVTREVHLFGNDMYTALQNTRNLTPSDNFEQFLDDLLSAIESGGDVTAFLEGETDTYLEEARDEQAGFIETLALLSEVFVVLFVAAPLFVIVLLIVMSLLGADTLGQVSVLVYVAMPLAVVAFLILLDVLSAPFEQPDVTLDSGSHATAVGDAALLGLVCRDVVVGAAERVTAAVTELTGPAEGENRDEAADAERRRQAYLRQRRRRHLVESASRPLAALDRNPVISLFATVPLAAGVVWYATTRGGHALSESAFLAAPVGATLWLVVAPFLIVTVPISLFVERRHGRERRISRQFPDTLNALSSANKMGVPTTDALELVAKWSSGPMERELRKVRNDIRWNHDPARALRALADSLRVPRISRSISLVAEGMRSSSDLARVLNIAAEDTRNRFKIDEERRRELSSYVAVVIIGYLVYLLVVALLTTAYLDQIAQTPATEPVPGTTMTPISISNLPISAYEVLFFHSAIIQAVGSGLLAGKLVENNALNGLKYSILLVLVASGAFLVI